MSLPEIKLDEGIHVMHLFYRINREKWQDGDSAKVASSLKEIAAVNPGPGHPRVDTYAGVGPRFDIGFVVYAETLVQAMDRHREIEAAFPAGSMDCVYQYVSVTELSEYASTEDDYKRLIQHQEKLEPGTEEFEKRLTAMNEKRKEYEHYRLYPELPKWEVMGFYPMAKRREGEDNWYSLDFDARKKLMAGHARVGRGYHGRVSQLITSSTGLDDWEWGVTLMAHQLDALRDIVYEMRFDEVSAKYGEFGPFYIGVTATPEDALLHLKLS